MIGFIIKKKNTPIDIMDSTHQIRDQVIVFIVGLLFAIGLMMAGMTRRINILQFLWIGKSWNPQLLFVLGCGVVLNFVTFQYMIRHRKNPMFKGYTLFNPQNNSIDMRLLSGAFIFGLGWGIGGLCPGPFLALFPTFTIPINVVWGVCLVIGQFLASYVADKLDKNAKKN